MNNKEINLQSEYINVAKTAGFCFGVNRAVEMVENLAESGKKVCTLGPIIHNRQLVEKLESKGVRIVENPTDAEMNEVLVIRSHGVPEDVETEARNHCAEVCDATCPFVAKIHRIVAKSLERRQPFCVLWLQHRKF